MRYILLLFLMGTSTATAAPQYKLYDFWASWCAPCAESFPVLQKLHEKYKDRIEFIGVNMDLDRRDMRIFLKKHPVSFSQIRDDNKTLIKKYKVQGLPTLVIVDETDKEVFRMNGYDSEGHGKIETAFCEILKFEPAQCQTNKRTK